MSIKSRIGKLESEHSGEPQVVIFRTFYENIDGSIDKSATTARASITWSKVGFSSAHMTTDETLEKFEKRVNGYEALTWAQLKMSKD